MTCEESIVFLRFVAERLGEFELEETQHDCRIRRLRRALAAGGPILLLDTEGIGGGARAEFPQGVPLRSRQAIRA